MMVLFSPLKTNEFTNAQFDGSFWTLQIFHDIKLNVEFSIHCEGMQKIRNCYKELKRELEKQKTLYSGSPPGTKSRIATAKSCVISQNSSRYCSPLSLVHLTVLSPPPLVHHLKGKFQFRSVRGEGCGR